MQDPLDAAEGVVDDVQVAERFGVDQPGSGAFTPDLDKESPLPVAEAGSPLSVNPRGPCSCGYGRGAALQAGLRFDHQRNAVPGRGEFNDFGDGAVKAFHRDVGCGISSRDAGRGVIRNVRGHDAFSLPAGRSTPACGPAFGPAAPPCAPRAVRAPPARDLSSAAGVSAA